jgi:hypothetical protein
MICSVYESGFRLGPMTVRISPTCQHFVTEVPAPGIPASDPVTIVLHFFPIHGIVGALFGVIALWDDLIQGRARVCVRT